MEPALTSQAPADRLRIDTKEFRQSGSLQIKPSSGPCGCWDVAQTRRMGISKRWEQPAKCAEVFALPMRNIDHKVSVQIEALPIRNP